MDLLQSKGVVLSSRRVGEADVICTVFTDNFGKRRFIMKGLKKSRKRGPSAAEPGSLVRLLYYYHEERSAYYASDVNIERFHTTLLNDLEGIYHLYYVLDLVERTSPFDVNDRPVYDLLNAGIEALPEAEDFTHFALFFSLRLLRLQGLSPDTTTCKSCARPLSTGFALDVSDLRPVCGDCIKSDTEIGRSLALRGGGLRLFTPAVRDYIARCLVMRFSSSGFDGLSRGDLLDLLFRISLFIEHYYHIELRTKDFILSGNMAKN